MTMKTTDVRNMTIIPSLDNLPGSSEGGCTAKDQPISQGSAQVQSPSGLVQDSTPDSTTLQPADSMSTGSAKPNVTSNGIGLGPRG